MRHVRARELGAIVLSLMAGAVAPSVAAAGSPDPQFAAKLYQSGDDAVIVPVRGEEDCEAFCIYDERGWVSTSIAGTDKTRGFQIGCDDKSFSYFNLALRATNLRVIESGTPYSLGSLLNFSSVINRCDRNVRLDGTDGQGPVVWRGQWVWDLGVPGFRINDRVEAVDLL